MMAKKKRKPVRIESEQSQARSTPKKARKLDRANDVYRKQANRIVELEDQIAKLSLGNHGRVVVEILVTPEAYEAIDRLCHTGLWGETVSETAALMVTQCVRVERYL